MRIYPKPRNLEIFWDDPEEDGDSEVYTQEDAEEDAILERLEERAGIGGDSQDC